MSIRDVDFPGWRQADGTLLWVTPMTAQNTQLRYGKFKALFRETLRPPRDDRDVPMIAFTHDGALRGQVMMGSGPRHVDVYAKRRAGTVVQIWSATRARRAIEDMQEIAGTFVDCEVTGVRAQRLGDLLEIPAMLDFPDRLDWTKPDAKVSGGAIAAQIWDTLIEETFRPVPHRYRWRANPWVWIHHCKEVR